ncbi:TPA: ead/Ea22-like family protein [Escherichia coli]|nr:ead/Ea22-like family protein [Escherichia coli]
MSEINYQALREAAEKATCGVWSLEYGEERFDAGDALIHREVVGYLPICRIEGAHPESGFDEDFQMEQQANAEFIAAANPATVLALLGELEAAKKRIAELEEREILLPERSSMLHRTDFHDDYQTVMAYKVSEVIDAIRATGIRIKGE